MKKRINMAIGFVCYALGVLVALYVGFWHMICVPIHELYLAFVSGNVTLFLVFVCALKLLFSTTLSGLIWCIGYIGYNHFKGIEDPDWEALENKGRQHDSESA